LEGGETVELNERKLQILKAIIHDYFETAEPVGSRTLSRHYDLGISPATIRNEMSDLEELGFIMQPHTSSGRIPSDKGYRFYVDMMLQLQKAEFTKLVYLEELKKSASRIEDMLKTIGEYLAKETHYTSIVSSPSYKKSKIKNIQLVEVEKRAVLAVIVTDGNAIKDYMIHLEHEVNQELLNQLTLTLNQHLIGLTLEDIGLDIIHKIKDPVEDGEEVIGKVIDVVFKTIREVDDSDIYTYGTMNILQYPEFNDISKASTLLKTLETKDVLKDIINTTIESDDGHVKIVIGEENELDGLKECSLITTSYHIGGEKVGAIGIIGPKRMDYDRTVQNLRCLIKNVDDLLNKL